MSNSNENNQLEKIVNNAKQISGAALVYLLLLNKKTNLFEGRVISGLEESLTKSVLKLIKKIAPHFDPLHQVYSMGSEVMRRLSKNKSYYITNRWYDVCKEKWPKALAEIVQRAGKIKKIIVFPLLWQGKIIGAMGFLMQEEIKKNKIEIMQAFVDQAAMTIEHINLYSDLKQLDEAKSEFIRIVSHHFRTPLSIIQWNLGLLLDGYVGHLENRKQKQIINSVYKNNYRLINSLENILTALEIAENKINLVLRPALLENIIRDVIRSFSHEAERKNITIKFNAAQVPLKPVYLDFRKIKRVLEILFNNALKYTLRGGKVVIKLKKIKSKKEGKQEFIQFSISDNGIGIPERDLPRLFTKFFRSAKAIKLVPDGTGLGLYIAKSFIELHGGKIWAISREGKGSTFYFTLPIKLRSV